MEHIFLCLQWKISWWQYIDNILAYDNFYLLPSIAILLIAIQDSMPDSKKLHCIFTHKIDQFCLCCFDYHLEVYICISSPVIQSEHISSKKNSWVVLETIEKHIAKHVAQKL